MANPNLSQKSTEKPAEKPVETPAKTPEPKDAPAPAAGGGLRKVTSPQNLRVVTKDMVVVQLKAGQPRDLPEHLVYAAQGIAAEKQIQLTVE